VKKEEEVPRKERKVKSDKKGKSSPGKKQIFSKKGSPEEREKKTQNIRKS
jgi:hypothetical protein